MVPTGKLRIDLNCDMGEGYGAYRMGDDAELMRHITSANIACGFHAGDPGTIAATVKLALEHDVAIGAHPGLPDLQGFGRRAMTISPREAYELTVYQIGAVQAFAAAEGVRVSHVKPHGALYNMAARDAALADAIAEAIYKVDGNMMLYGLSGSELIRSAERLGLRAANEVFADRSYEEDGSLTPRHAAGAVLADSAEASAQIVRLVRAGEVKTRQGTWLRLQADTVCVHGDSPDALSHVRALGEALREEGIELGRADRNG
ncbi:5-oxoprolinase subunit PxpA [Paenibacillus sp. LHD-117]|uniref:LamB/YcsF family protein n=1 Tax=Paenibacillus sp. LHD-117 TaxID=3071412 RepID=UPI0027E18114|nr:5-oxoprolinase subunit PxpA [Paenibacillus sp. LHD-117]MDQ6422558.1 5-oxoprolinase subunit PxpA [Paenibacillus sp. LHD-117]